MHSTQDHLQQVLVTLFKSSEPARTQFSLLLKYKTPVKELKPFLTKSAVIQILDAPVEVSVIYHFYDGTKGFSMAYIPRTPVLNVWKFLALMEEYLRDALSFIHINDHTGLDLAINVSTRREALLKGALIALAEKHPAEYQKLKERESSLNASQFYVEAMKTLKPLMPAHSGNIEQIAPTSSDLLTLDIAWIPNLLYAIVASNFRESFPFLTILYVRHQQKVELHSISFQSLRQRELLQKKLGNCIMASLLLGLNWDYRPHVYVRNGRRLVQHLASDRFWLEWDRPSGDYFLAGDPLSTEKRQLAGFSIRIGTLTAEQRSKMLHWYSRCIVSQTRAALINTFSIMSLCRSRRR